MTNATTREATHEHRFGPVFTHIETEKRACLICGFAAPARIIQYEQVAGFRESIEIALANATKRDDK